MGEHVFQGTWVVTSSQRLVTSGLSVPGLRSRLCFSLGGVGKQCLLKGTLAKDVVQVSWNIRAFGYPVFPEMAYSNDKAECAELFK